MEVVLRHQNGAYSVLYPNAAARPRAAPAPAYFRDLNLDQVVASVVAGREEYELEPFLREPLTSIEAIVYRQEAFRELEGEELRACVNSFAAGMKAVREQRAKGEGMRHPLQRQRWFLDSARTYGQTVTHLADALDGLELRSTALRAFREWLVAYERSLPFRSLAGDAVDVDERLATVAYTVHMKGRRVTVGGYDGEADYSEAVERTFAKFTQSATRDYRTKLVAVDQVNHVEASILDRVALLHPGAFDALARFCEDHGDYLDPTIAAFDREIQLYAAYLDHVARLSAAGLSFCYPTVCGDGNRVRARETFDLALADAVIADGGTVVCNDFRLDAPERIFVVTGPNQGGKTTFARTFGQLHHLACLGCPVPGSDARLSLFDAIFTHFERAEDIGDLSGKLATELERVHATIEQASARSIVVMNESFSSTTLDDALFLGTRVLEALIEIGVLGVCVTFVDELASLGDATVSMVSAIAPDDPTVRTYKLERRAADGLAYAAVIAEKYGLGYESLKERITA